MTDHVEPELPPTVVPDVRPLWSGPVQCTATRKSGGRCSHTHGLVEGLCVFHHPARRSELTAMRVKGAQAAAVSRAENRKVRLAMASADAGPRPPVGDGLEEIGAWLKWCLESAARGSIELGQLVAFTSTARALQAVYEKRDLERQLKAAQRQLDRLQRAKQ